MTPRQTLPSALALLALGLLGCDATADITDTTPVPAVEGDHVVLVMDNDFEPQRVEVTVGETVTWDFAPANRPHNVVFDDGRASDVTDTGSWSATFTEPGTHNYDCTLHAGMSGQVIVATG